MIAFSPPLVIMGMDAGVPVLGLSASEAVMLVTLPPLPCESICFTASWVTKMNPSEVGGDESAEVLDSVLGERLRKEDAGIVDQMVDRAELLRAVCVTFSAVAGWPMSPSTSASFGDGAKPAFEMLREVATTL